MYKSLDELRQMLCDIQISFLQLAENGEDLVVGLIDYLGRESQMTAKGIYQLSMSRVPGDRPSYTILNCTIEELTDSQIEKSIPGYAMTYVRWPTQTQKAIHLRLEGDIVIDLTCSELVSLVA